MPCLSSAEMRYIFRIEVFLRHIHQIGTRTKE